MKNIKIKNIEYNVFGSLPINIASQELQKQLKKFFYGNKDSIYIVQDGFIYQNGKNTNFELITKNQRLIVCKKI
jgi:hypothetical protein